MFWTILQVAAGGALGAVGRYLTGAAASRFFSTGLPLGTISVNILGSFIMGVAFVFLMMREQEALRFVPFVMTGVLGGFTTFSAFSLDVWTLFERGRFIAGLLYLGGSVGVSILAVTLGIAVARGMVS